MAQRTAKQRRADNARQAKLAELRAAERRRRARVIGSLGAVGVIVVIVLIMVGIKLGTGTGNGNGDQVSNTAAGKVVKQVTGVPASVFSQVGAGSLAKGPIAINGGDAITKDGKPEVLYVGAEYCPFCAAERWAVVAALSRFGTWSNVGLTNSSSNDYAPDTPTLSFHGADYSSDYISFAGYETEDRDQQPLDTLPSDDQKILQKYDAPPYVDQSSAGSIPFVYYGGKYFSNGASFDPLLMKDMTHAEVAKAMHDPNSKVGQAIDGTANSITAAVCKLTGNKPANVCTAPGVKAGAGKLQPAS